MVEAVLTAPIGHNMPPLRETAKSDIETQLDPLRPRYQELVESLTKAKCGTDEEAGKCADLGKQMSKLEKRIDAVRKDVKEPYDEAAKVVDAGARPMREALNQGIQKLKGMIGEFDRRQREAEATRLREQAARDREEQERVRVQQQEEAERLRAAGVTAAPPPPPEPEPEPEPARKAPPAPIARGDYGASAGRTVRMVPSITDVYALPRDVLEAPKVTEAILSVVRAMRSGNPDMEIKGIELVEATGVTFR